MNHFVYAMNGKAQKAPAAGGDMKSWFFFYKWDTGEETFVPVPAEVPGGRPAAKDLLWFVLDGVPLGFVPIVSVVDADDGGYEIRYDTQKIIGHDNGLTSFELKPPTGLADAATVVTLDRLKNLFEVTFAPRPSSALPVMPDDVHPGQSPTPRTPVEK